MLDLDRRELAVVTPLVALIIVLGVYPQPLLNLIEPAVSATMSDLGGSAPMIRGARPLARRARAAAVRLRRGLRRRARRGVRAARRAGTRCRSPSPSWAPLGALVSTLLLAGTREVTAGGALAVDGAGLFLQATIAGLGALAILLFAERALDPARSAFVTSAAVPAGSPRDRELLTSERVQTEVYPLATFAIGGMMLFVAANDLLIMFVALEVLSLPLYLISGLARRRRLLSQEAAVKYFLLGAFASAFFLYGLALVYGATGSVRLGDIRGRGGRRAAATSCWCSAWRCSIVGLLFKASVAPFHTWTPDVYQGAPTPVTAFMAACTKVAAFGAILRLLYVAFGTSEWTWRPLIYGVAIVSMIVGAVLGLTQTDLKRMLAYSSIAHAGLPPHRRDRAQRAGDGVRAGGHDVLPARLRPHHDRRLRRPHPGPGRRRRGRATCRSGRGWPRGRR